MHVARLPCWTFPSLAVASAVAAAPACGLLAPEGSAAKDNEGGCARKVDAALCKSVAQGKKAPGGRDLSGCSFRGVDFADLDRFGVPVDDKLANLTGGQTETHVGEVPKAVDMSDWSDAVLHGTDFSGAVLGESVAAPTRNGAGALRPGEPPRRRFAFYASDLCETRFDGALMAGSIFEEAAFCPLDGDAHQGQLLGSFPLQGNQHGKVQRSYLKHGVPVLLSFAHADLSDARFAEISPYEAEGFHSAGFSHVDLSRAQLGGAELEAVTGSYLLAPESRWHEAQLSDVELSFVWLDDGDFARAHLANVELRWLRGRRSNWQEARLEGVEMDDAMLKWADFTAAQMETVSFERAKLTEARFAGAVLDEVDFKGANLGHATFVGTRFVEVYTNRKSDFRSALFDGVVFGSQGSSSASSAGSEDWDPDEIAMAGSFSKARVRNIPEGIPRRSRTEAFYCQLSRMITVRFDEEGNRWVSQRCGTNR